MGFDGVCYGWVLMGFAMGGFRWFGFAVSLGLGLLPQVVRSVGCFFFFFSFFLFFSFFFFLVVLMVEEGGILQIFSGGS